MSRGSVGFVVALPCEAKPLTNAWQLKRQHDSKAYPYFVNAERGWHLVVSGVGAHAAAAATAWLAGQLSEPVALINIGIAGGTDEAIGSLWLADKITDVVTDHSFYPMGLSVLLKHQDSRSLTTVYQPAMAEQGLVDMEASGFYMAALRFVPQSMAHCLKVVSDNHKQPHGNINKHLVAQYVAAQLPSIEQMASAVVELGGAVHFASDWQEAMWVAVKDKYRFSQYQQHQLLALLQQCDGQGVQGLFEQCVQDAKTSKILLHAVEEMLQKQALIKIQEAS